MISAENKTNLEKMALSVRSLSMDAIQKANSGHPGLPMGCAELGALLFAETMRHDPSDPAWINRDRFVLSAGHGSMFLYSLLHLSGYPLSIDDLKNFRQLDSLTPGHPEYGHTVGVETTTGPLGAGVSNAVGMAMAETHVAARLNAFGKTVIDHYTWALAGDGCMMEGISSEAASMAGHLGLGKLIVIYDSNNITIEGDTEIAFTENVGDRYRAYNWQVLEGDAYNFDQMAELFEQAKAEKDRPTLVVLKSVIGKGAPNKEGSHSVHGAPLGDDEIKASRKLMGIAEDEAFYVDPAIAAYMQNKKGEWKKAREEWQASLDSLSGNADFKKEWDALFGKKDYDALPLPEYKAGDSMATRKASGNALQVLGNELPSIIGGSADLAPSNNTFMNECGEFSRKNRLGRNIHFGVREHAMGGVANGMLLYGGLKTYCATFLVFSDYMRPTVRLASLMNIPQIFVFTHDSIFVGEDGPTHQPIEHVESLRNIPGLLVLRPADAEETSQCWRFALAQTARPSALILTRQNLTVTEKPASWKDDFKKGAYVVKESAGEADAVIFATGSEVGLALEAAEKSGKNIRVVSVTSRELLLENRDHLASLKKGAKKSIAVEAGVTSGWYQVADEAMGINRFGLSGPGAQVAQALGLTADVLVKMI